MKKYFDTKAESLEEKIKQIFGETVAKEGNKFTKALMAARDAGRKFFSVNGKQYETNECLYIHRVVCVHNILTSGPYAKLVEN